MNAIHSPASQIVKAMQTLDRGHRDKKAANTIKVGKDDGLKHAMSQGKPGSWSSDHREEARSYTGYNYICIESIASQASQAIVSAVTVDLTSRKKSLAGTEEGEPFELGSPLMQFLMRPNPKQSGASFRYEQAMQLRLTGSALVWNVRNGFGKVVERYVIPTAIAQPSVPNADHPFGYWKINPEGSRYNAPFLLGGLIHTIGYDIDARDMQTIRLPHPILKDDGCSPVNANAVWSDLARGIDTSRASSMKNGMKPSYLVTLEGSGANDVDDFEAIVANLNNKYAGAEKDGKIMVVEGGKAKVTKLSNTPDEMDYEKSHDQTRDDILANHRTPPVALGIVSPSGREGLYAPLEQYAFLTIQPLLNLMAEEDNEFWVWQYGKGARVIYTARSIQDRDREGKELKQGITAKAINKNEVRAFLGLEPWDAERGNQLAGDPDPTSESESEDEGFMPKKLDSTPPTKPSQKPPVDESEDVDDEPDSKKKSLDSQPSPKPLKFIGLDELNSSFAKSRPTTETKFSCVMLMLDEPTIDVIQSMQKQINVDDLVGDGLEDEPHITVKYGLHTSNPVDILSKIGSFGPVEVTVGSSSIFESDEHDVVKLNVSGDELFALNERVSQLPHTDTHPEYQPHITLAYVTRGSGTKYIDKLRQLNGRKLTFDRYVFGDPDHDRTTFGLDGSATDNSGEFNPENSSFRKAWLPHNSRTKAFCPTGEGGGIDNSCPGNGGNESGENRDSDENQLPTIDKTDYNQTNWRPDWQDNPDPSEFIRSRDKMIERNPAFKPFLSPIKPEDLKDYQLFLSADGKVGAALSPDGDIQNVFNAGGPRGAGSEAMIAAIQAGGVTLDCYDKDLPSYYSNFGFTESQRMRFSRDQAPEDWDYEIYFEPDIVFMALTDVRTEKEMRNGANRKSFEWQKPERSADYTDDWDGTKERSRALSRASKGTRKH